MNRHLARMLVAAGLMGAVVGGGCLPYRNAVDPCWPERYNHTARKEIVDGFAPQVQNGHVLDQTIWNYMFVTGTDELNGVGKYKLDYMIRRRPMPDPNIFLQTAHDVMYNPQEPDRYADQRRELDQRRVAAIRAYLSAQTVGRPMAFDVAIHDPYTVGAPASYASGSMKLATAPSKSGPLGDLVSGGGGGAGAQGTPGAPGGATPGAGYGAAPAQAGAAGGGATHNGAPQ